MLYYVAIGAGIGAVLAFVVKRNMLGMGAS